MKYILKQIFCKHEYEWNRNLTGPLAMMFDKTEYKCKKCGKSKWYWPHIYKKFDWNIL